MYKEARIYSLLERVEDAILLVREQTEHIVAPDDFLNSSSGMFLLGGVCMQLIFIGESIKVLDAKNAGYSWCIILKSLGVRLWVYAML